MQSWKFYRHMPVYTRGRQLLGRAEEIGHAVDYVHVQQGRVIVRDWYVPLTAVEGVDADGIYLAAEREELLRNGWNVPPREYLELQGATPGYEYISPSEAGAYRAETTR